MEDDLQKKWKTTSNKLKYFDPTRNTTSKKNGRRPSKKNGRRPQKKWKMTSKKYNILTQLERQPQKNERQP